MKLIRNFIEFVLALLILYYGIPNVYERVNYYVSVRNSDIMQAFNRVTSREIESFDYILRHLKSKRQVNYHLTIPADASNNMIVKTALKYRDAKYKLGQANVRRTDCSGLTYSVFKELGIRLPRTVRGQYRVGKFVSSIDRLRIGDLVFFNTKGMGPSHVGIHIGKHKMIHASSGARAVIISDIRRNYYKSRFIGGKRIIG